MTTFRANCRGFTFIELVVAIAVSSIVVVFAAMFVKAPIDAYLSQARHTELVDSVGIAWPSMQQDIQSALPNSVRARRNGSVVVLEMLHVRDAAAYLTTPNAPSFTTAGLFRVPVRPGPSAAGEFYMSVNNLGTGLNDAYRLSRVMTPANTTFRFNGPVGSAQDTIVATPTPAFTYSPVKSRIYLVDGPVTYLCNETAQTIRRYDRYSIAAAQTSRDTDAELNAAGAVSKLVARNISKCDFQRTAETATVGQIATVRLTALRNGESVTTMYRAAVEKLPP